MKLNKNVYSLMCKFDKGGYNNYGNLPYLTDWYANRLNDKYVISDVYNIEFKLCVDNLYGYVKESDLILMVEKRAVDHFIDNYDVRYKRP